MTNESDTQNWGFPLLPLQAWKLYCIETMYPQGHPMTAVELRTAIS